MLDDVLDVMGIEDLYDLLGLFEGYGLSEGGDVEVIG